MFRLFLALLLTISPIMVFASPSNTLSITPVAVDGTTITASDENTRNNTITTTYNAHSHTDISQTANTLNVGDATSGNKTITANNADSNKPFIRFDDTNDYWTFSSDGINTAGAWTSTGMIFEGATANDYETTIVFTDPTADRTITFPDSTGSIAVGLGLPAGAVFFMLTGSCPTGSTDITATYNNKFIKINATQGTSSGVVLTGTSDSTTLSAAQSGLPAHTHTYSKITNGAGSDPGSGETQSFNNAAVSGSTGGTAASSGHTHTLSTATTLEPSSVTMKLCQVD